MSEQLYTVAMLTYNRAKTDVASIGSVAADPYVHSVKVFDDGSTEESLKAFRRCCGSFENVSLVQNSKNLGYCSNLVLALEYLCQAETEYVFLCESDMLLVKGWGGDDIQCFFKLQRVEKKLR